MKIYYANLQAIEQQTMQLDTVSCPYCKRTHQLVSHGFIRKKKNCAEPEAVGKRVFCSNRYHHKGCGRTIQLYLDATVRYLHHASSTLVAFMLSLIAGMSIQAAYCTHVTGARTPRQAYRWLNRLDAQLSAYRGVSHRPPLCETAACAAPNRSARLVSLLTTFTALLHHLGPQPCAAYQLQLQRTFF